MNSTQPGQPGPSGQAGGSRAGGGAVGDGRAVTAGAYVALFLLGAVLGLIGTFQYSRGPVPVTAICFGLGILAICLLGAWGMRTGAGGVLPAAGWLIVTILLSSGKGDSVLITDSTAGKWFLFGGALCAAAGAVLSYVLVTQTGILTTSRAKPSGRPH